MDPDLRNPGAAWFEVILVNARYAKNVPGRKTDVSMSRGYARFILLACTWQLQTRRRDCNVARLSAPAGAAGGICAARIQHMQKALIEMYLHLRTKCARMKTKSPAVSMLIFDRPRSRLINRTTSHAPLSALPTWRTIPSTG